MSNHSDTALHISGLSPEELNTWHKTLDDLRNTVSRIMLVHQKVTSSRFMKHFPHCNSPRYVVTRFITAGIICGGLFIPGLVTKQYYPVLLCAGLAAYFLCVRFLPLPGSTEEILMQMVARLNVPAGSLLNDLQFDRSSRADEIAEKLEHAISKELLLIDRKADTVEVGD